MKRLLTVALLIALIVGGFIFFRKDDGDSNAPASVSSARAFSSAQPPPASIADETKSASTAAQPLEVSDVARELNSPATDIHADLKLLRAIFDDYRTNLRLNPTGNNAEITAALTGKNSLRLALIPPRHRAINAEGELCDRWGTSFFFHQLSGTQMEIHSAGPDRKMWTDDDIVLSP
jgi:hypothetical protein